ncbi:hypothetical protein GCM10023259_083020 [Thermocatellispora tengchongensis]
MLVQHWLVRCACARAALDGKDRAGGQFDGGNFLARVGDQGGQVSHAHAVIGQRGPVNPFQLPRETISVAHHCDRLLAATHQARSRRGQRHAQLRGLLLCLGRVSARRCVPQSAVLGQGLGQPPS